MKKQEHYQLDPELLKGISIFERFSHQLGFKRIDGAIYGLLVLADRALSSEDIQSTLNLSQSAVSMGLKNLSQYGAIETFEDRVEKCKVHGAKEDSLTIAATVFRKREQQDILDFKDDVKRMLSNVYKNGDTADSSRVKRLKSIISTCDIADAVTNFVIGLNQMSVNKNYDRIKRILPQVLDTIAASGGTLETLTGKLKNNLTEKLKHAPLASTLADNFIGKLTRFTQDQEGKNNEK